jgi:hypothetical protein
MKIAFLMDEPVKAGAGQRREHCKGEASESNHRPW